MIGHKARPPIISVLTNRLLLVIHDLSCHSVPTAKSINCLCAMCCGMMPVKPAILVIPDLILKEVCEIAFSIKGHSIVCVVD